MYYYLALAPNGTQYVATPSPLKEGPITPLTEEQYDIIMDIYRSKDKGEKDLTEENG